MNTKLSLTLSLLLGSAALFQGCSSTDDTTQPTTNTSPAEVSTTIQGSTTLASGPRTEQKATVCLDINSDNVCNDDEPQTNTDSAGDYTLTIDTEVADGTVMLVEGGFSMLPQDENSTGSNTLQMLKYYNSSEGDQNINALSTLILQELKDSPSNTYEEILANISSRRTIDKETLLQDPIDVSRDFFGDGNKFFRYVSALEISMNRRANSSVQRAAALQRASESTTTPTDSEIDAIINEYSTVFDDFLASISEYINEVSTSIGNWYDSFFEEGTGTTEPEPEPEPEPVEPVEVEITRQVLEGTWHIVDRSGDISCSTISGDTMVVREPDGTSTTLSLNYRDSDKSMSLVMGWIKVEDIYFDSYWSDKKFYAHYGSDGETMEGQLIATESACLDLIRQ